MELLERYHQLAKEQDDINKELGNIRAELKARVEKSGNVEGFGVRAYMKAGRKSINHEAAVEAKGQEYIKHDMHSLFSELSTLIESASTTKTTVAWAKVTKAARIDTTPFVTESEPSFVIEVD